MAGAQAERASVLDAVRAFGVMLAGSVALVSAAAAGLAATLRATVRGRLPSPLVFVGDAAIAGYVLAVRPWLLQWGSSADENARALPGDELVPNPGAQTTRAVVIDAPVQEVWPWLSQIGQDRGGFYSYQWLENLAGCRMRNADRIHPEWQDRRVGETVLLHPATGLKLARFEPPRLYAFRGWYFVLDPDDGRTRLIARGRYPKGLVSVAYALLLELPHFIMERRMLLGIKRRAERNHREVNQV